MLAELVAHERAIDRFAELQIEGRSDDTPETIRHRIRVYRRETAPLIDYYRGRSLLREVDGMGSEEQVEQAIAEALAA